MGKLLFWIVVIVAALFVARLLAQKAGKRRPAPPQAAPRGNASTAREPLPQMTRCAHCGIHLPRAEALLLKGNTWCCEAHAELGPRPLD
jgi:uncharacterized protein